jgi:phosphate acetyltransferase
VTSISWHDFRQKALSQGPARRVVLADGEDARVVQAALEASRLGLAKPILVGRRAPIEKLMTSATGDRPAIFDIEQLSEGDRGRHADALMALPKFKSLSKEEANARLKDSLVSGCLLLREHEAEGFIGGASRTTADTLRAVFSIIGLAPKTSALFGFFLLEKRLSDGDVRELVLLADCAVVPEPSPKQLAAIAVGAADAYRAFTGGEPRVAFLSFSTAGSAEHPFVDKVRQARDLAREKAPSLQIEGEWQADAALDAFSATIKGVGDSPMAGRANVLIAPTLETGNIAYKLVQRLGGCRAVGPVLWGTAQPANDLSRGCSSEDVLDMIALTSLQAHGLMQPAGAPKSQH